MLRVTLNRESTAFTASISATRAGSVERSAIAASTRDVRSSAEPATRLLRLPATRKPEAPMAPLKPLLSDA